MKQGVLQNFFLVSGSLTLLIFSCSETLNSSEDASANPFERESRRGASSLPTFSSEREKLDFLQGKFSPDQYLSPYKVDGKVHYLLPEVLVQYKKMVRAFEEEMKITNPGYKQSMFIVSAFRNYWQQKSIWEAKFKGERKMREPIQGKKPEEIVSLILEFSSAPGTSRHHWGTDLDLNSLDNAYFEKGGKGEILYSWLHKNAHRFGFCQPYNELIKRENQGYSEEKWHWSYKPISSLLRNEWIEAYSAGKMKLTGFLGSEFLQDKALVYVSSVNQDCW